MALPIPQYNPSGFREAADAAASKQLQGLYLERDAENTRYNRERQAAADQRVAAKYEQDLNDREREILAKVYAPMARDALEFKDGGPRAYFANLLANPRVAAQFKRDDFMDATDLQDPEFEVMVQGLAQMVPAQKPTAMWEDVQGPRGSRLQRNPATGELRQVVGPDNSQPAPQNTSRFVPLTPAEIEAAGLPPGTSAQRDSSSGKIDVLSKRDATGGLSQKDMTTARLKLNNVSIARKQLANIQKAFDAIKNSTSAGPGGQGRLPTPSGRAFDRAVDQMRSTLTSLTRVPGVGAMSDYETKLDQAKFPDRKEYEQVTQQQISDLGQLLDGIESGYSDLMGGNAGNVAPQQAQPQQEITATNPQTGQKIVLRNGQWVPL